MRMSSTDYKLLCLPSETLLARLERRPRGGKLDLGPFPSSLGTEIGQLSFFEVDSPKQLQ